MGDGPPGLEPRYFHQGKTGGSRSSPPSPALVVSVQPPPVGLPCRSVVIVPGVPCDPGAVEVLTEAAPAGAAATVFVPPGYGDSPAGDGTFASRRRALRQAIEALPADGRWIIGCSAGAYDALGLVDEGVPVAGLILLGGVTGPGDAGREAYRGLAALFRAGTVPNGLLAGAVLGPSSASQPALVARVEAWRDAASDAHIANELADYAELPSLDHAIGTLGSRCWIVHGTDDPSMPLDAARALAATHDANFEALPGVGHAPFIEDPGAVVNVLRRIFGDAR